MEINTISLIIVFGLFVVVIESVRRGILEVQYSILWLFTCFILGMLSLFESILNAVAKMMHVYYAPSILFLFGLLFSLIIIFDLTRRISKMNHFIVTLSQDFSLLKQDYDQLKSTVEQPPKINIPPLNISSSHKWEEEVS